MLLRLSDFPDGWRASAPAAEDRSAQEKFRKCVGVDFSNLTLRGDANSKDFAMGESTEASSRAQIFASSAQAASGFQQFAASMGGTAVKGCVKKLLGKAAKGFKVGEVDVGELRARAPADVEKAKAWEVVIPIEVTSGAGQGLSATAYLDLSYLLKGDAISNVQTSDVFSPFDSALREQLVQKVAARM